MKDHRCQIWNSLGQLMSSGYLTTGATRIDLSDYPMGIYYLRSEQGLEKLVLQR